MYREEGRSSEADPQRSFISSRSAVPEGSNRIQLLRAFAPVVVPRMIYVFRNISTAEVVKPAAAIIRRASSAADGLNRLEGRSSQ